VITAIVLIKTSVDRIPEIAESIAALESVSEVFSVTGTYDLIAMVRVRQHEDLAEVIPGRISKIPGVEGTDTHVAFRTYSQHDLEAGDRRHQRSRSGWTWSPSIRGASTTAWTRCSASCSPSPGSRC
jgi:DNA-binding Lrp family transcriptional regulator